MGTTYLKPGHTPEFANSSGSDIAVDDVIFPSGFACVAQVNIPDGQRGTVSIDGIHDLPAASGAGTDATFGAKAYWDMDNKQVTKTATDYYLGRFVKSKATTDVRTQVHLNKGVLELDITQTVEDVSPDLQLAAVDGTDGTTTLTIQVKDAAGVNVAAVHRLRVWTGDADDMAPDAITEITATTGAILVEHTANADVDVVTDANGTAVLVLDNNGAGTIYAWAELAGKVSDSCEAVITSA